MLRRADDLLAVEFTMAAGEIENLSGLPNDWFSRDAAEVVRLKSPNQRTESIGEAAVIPFRKR